MDGLHDHLARYRDSFLSTDHSQVSVNDMWVSFKSEVLSAIEMFIPSKMTKPKYSLPCMRGSRNFHERGSKENGNFWSKTRGGPTPQKIPKLPFF